MISCLDLFKLLSFDHTRHPQMDQIAEHKRNHQSFNKTKFGQVPGS